MSPDGYIDLSPYHGDKFQQISATSSSIYHHYSTDGTKSLGTKRSMQVPMLWINNSLLSNLLQQSAGHFVIVYKHLYYVPCII